MRIVCMSDSHGFHKKLNVPDGDVFIHAGDFSMRAQIQHVQEFARWMNSLPHKHKIVVPGNHDIACETNSRSMTKDMFGSVVYLDHEYHQVEGIMVFGSPYTSAIANPSDWSFDYPRGGHRGFRLWDQVLHGDRMDILVTHGPAYGILDRVLDPHFGEDPHVGEKGISNIIEKHKPKVHIFGHIHEGYGHVRESEVDYYNVSVCTEQYKPTNPITTIDFI